MTKKLLFIGFGDIASRCVEQLIPQNYNCTGIARRDKPIPAGLNFWRGDINDAAMLKKIASAGFDVIIVTMTPSERGPEGYQRAYVQPAQQFAKLLTQLAARRAGKLPCILYVSSTSVYSQRDGEWVNAETPMAPSSATSEQLILAEETLAAAPGPTTRVRFSGIYGPGRDFLLNQVRQGIAGDEHYTNRIHVDDCAGFLCFLIERHLAGQTLAPVYLASDDEPVSAKDIREWLAKRLHVTLTQPARSSGRGHKRCDNRQLAEIGYRLQYPTFREGYQAIITGTEK